MANNPSQSRKSSFTGRARRRQTRPAVVWQDRVASLVIRIGGLGTILSVLGVLVFLLWVALPLFRNAQSHDETVAPIAPGPVAQIGIDEYQLLGWLLRPEGQLEVLRIDDGSRVFAEELFAPGVVSAISLAPGGRLAAFGQNDGRITLVELEFVTQNLREEDLEADQVAALREGKILTWQGGVLARAGQDQVRFQKLEVSRQAPIEVAAGPVRAVAYGVSADGPLVAVLADSPPSADPSQPAAVGEASRRELKLLSFVEKTDFLTGETSLESAAPLEIPYQARPNPPTDLVLSGAGTDLYLTWADGLLDRFNLRDLADIQRLERGFLLDPAGGNQLTRFASILGGNTFLWGDRQGRLRGGFPVRPAESERQVVGLLQAERSETSDQVFAKTKELVLAGAAVGPIAATTRTRLAMAGFADGRIRLFNVTNETELWSAQLPGATPIQALVVSPKEDGVLAAAGGQLYHARLETGYSEAGFRAFFRPVWYEGYPEPDHVWQSSSGTDDFEMKLGLMPLIFGTVKATLYSMLFGAPIALLAAIFTSEFLRGRARAIIKPSIEIMASLPSVVLGFLAALVIAPLVEGIVPAVLAAVFVLPFLFLLGAQLWQILPSDISIRFQDLRFVVICLLIPPGLLFSYWVGPHFENWFFAGDFKAWLAWDGITAGPLASPTGGWILLTLPLAALVVTLAMERFASPWMRSRAHLWDRRRFALVDLAKLLVGCAATFVFAWVLAVLLGAIGFDPRGVYLDTYVQRNAMIVGFVMGFAIIPIIYTISEDALSTVPQHLRSASLGAGATPWQTAVRIVIPTAMSGLFSAVMVGLGRAVGETMIVLMAAGNTPVMSWNLFEGFRTLSANIAVELPEAVRGGIHYRTLFLAALVLFVMTFAVNTVAEVIRQRFRKRAYQL